MLSSLFGDGRQIILIDFYKLSTKIPKSVVHSMLEIGSIIGEFERHPQILIGSLWSCEWIFKLIIFLNQNLVVS
jgi:hypothetical protein